MPKKQIKEVTVVDELSGEVLSRQAVYSNKFAESFIMLRTTESLDWVFALTANEFKVLLLLHQWSESSEGRLSLAVWQKELLCDKLNIKTDMLSAIIRGLLSKDCLLKLGNNDFVVNPAHVFRCSTHDVRERIRKYEYLKDKIKNGI